MTGGYPLAAMALAALTFAGWGIVQTRALSDTRGRLALSELQEREAQAAIAILQRDAAERAAENEALHAAMMRMHAARNAAVVRASEAQAIIDLIEERPDATDPAHAAVLDAIRLLRERRATPDRGGDAADRPAGPR